jgi:hypothetical protein
MRLVVAGHAQALERPLAIGDRLLDGVRWLRANPAWPIGTAVALLAMRPRRLLRWSSRLWWGWRVWRRASRLLQVMDPGRR